MTRRVESSADSPEHGRVRWVVLTTGWAGIFVALAIGTELLTGWAAAQSNPDDGADIGLGLLLLAGWAIAGGLAGGVDGWLPTLFEQLPGSTGLTMRWAVVGLAAGLAAAVYRSVDDNHLGTMDVLANFALSTVGESVLVAGPALLAAALVTSQLAASAGRREQREAPSWT